MAVIEIDQSGKWEAGSHTAIGASISGHPLGAMVERHEKDRVFRLLTGFSQERTKSKKARIARFFAYTVFLTIRNVVRPGDILLIDQEYAAQEQTIRDLMVHLFRRFSTLSIDPKNIQFGHVGKTTQAHWVAHKIFGGRREPDVRWCPDGWPPVRPDGGNPAARVEKKARPSRMMRLKPCPPARARGRWLSACPAARGCAAPTRPN